MDQPVVGHRGNSHRELQRGAEQIDSRGALGDVDERARAERMASEHFPVGRQGAFRATAAFDEVPYFRGKLIARRAFDPGQREWCHGRPRSRTGRVRTGPRIGSVGGLDLIGIDLDLTNRLCNRLATELDVLPGVDDGPGKWRPSVHDKSPHVWSGVDRLFLFFTGALLTPARRCSRRLGRPGAVGRTRG